MKWSIRTLHLYGIKYEAWNNEAIWQTIQTDWEQNVKISYLNEWTKRKIVAIVRKMDMFGGIILYFVIFVCLVRFWSLLNACIFCYFIHRVKWTHSWNLNTEYWALHFPVSSSEWRLSQLHITLYTLCNTCVRVFSDLNVWKQ